MEGFRRGESPQGDPALHRISGQPERRAGIGWKMGGRGLNRRGRHHAALSNLALSHPR